MRTVKHNDRSQPAVPETKPSRRTDLQRRGFLLTLGVGGVGAAVVAARTLGGGAIEPGVAGDPDADSAGYAMTDHVRRYYRTAKV